MYVAVLLFGLFWSDHVIFPRTPASYTDTAEYLKLTASDGNRITARYLANPKAEFTLLVSHGNAQDLGDAREWLQTLHDAGFKVFAYDYEGYGTSEGYPSEARTNDDERTALTYLVRELKTPTSRIILLGQSLGSGPAVHLAAREPVAGLILQSAFTSTFRVLTRVPIFPFDKFANYHEIGRVRCPVLIIHGTADRVVALWHGKELYARANQPKSFLWVEGADHDDLEDVAGPRYAEALRAFATSLR